MAAEDIDITWKLNLAGWRTAYLPGAICRVLMPETFGGLWKQRLRWAQGGCEVLRRHGFRACSWKCRQVWPLFYELVAGLLWSHAVAFSVLLWLVADLGCRVPWRFLSAIRTLPCLGPIRRWGPLPWFSLLPGSIWIHVTNLAGIVRICPRLVSDGLLDHWSEHIGVGFAKVLFRHQRGNAVWEAPHRGFAPQPHISLPPLVSPASKELELAESVK